MYHKFICRCPILGIFLHAKITTYFVLVRHRRCENNIYTNTYYNLPCFNKRAELRREFIGRCMRRRLTNDGFHKLVNTDPSFPLLWWRVRKLARCTFEQN
ncbi:hypothetical protein HanPSC8_Chr12g0502581 [Helianthus annuus]|nr:hypothetical protein HanPSC8_Chr12g0502581 [Helianthus annuus]